MFDEELEEQSGPSDRGGKTRNPRSVQVAESCPVTTLAGEPCRMRPTAATGKCMAHSSRKATITLRAARASLAAQKAAMIERYGLQAELPSLDSVEALGAYLASVAARIEAKQLTPAQGNTLVAVVKQSAALLGLSLDIKLAEQLDALEGRR